MSKFNKLYNLIMEDMNLKINQKISDYIDDGKNFDDIPYLEQREIILSMDLNVQVYGEEARGLYYNVTQFDLCFLLREFYPELYRKYLKEDWNDQDVAKKYAAILKDDKIEIPNYYAYYSKDKGVQTWQDVANDVWEYYGV